MLYKILIDPNEGSYQETLNLATKALEILDQTNSVKRLGIILVENFIATSILALDTSRIKARLQESYGHISPDELAQIKRIYFKFRKNNAIEKLDFLES